MVWPNIESNARYEANMGISLISAVLKKEGHETLLFEPDVFSKEKFAEEVRRYNPDLVGFSVTTHQYQYAVKYAELLKQIKNVPTIFGGFHPTLAPESVIANPYVDIICRGEGEATMLSLANALREGKDYSGISNLWVKRKNGQIVKNPPADLIEDLDSLPFADREFISQEEILKNNGFRLDMAVGRGCPYQCPYCCNSALHQIYKDKGKFVRLRSVDNVLKELSSLLKKYRVKEIHFQDDMFLLNKQWLKEFAGKYSQNFNLPFHISARVEHIDQESAELLKKSGCVSVTIGVESGNEWLRKNVLKKSSSNQDILNARQFLKQAGIKICSLNMIGVPEETPLMIEETIAFNKKLKPDWLACSIFSPYPGTALYQFCREKGYLSKNNFEEFSPSYLNEKSASILNLPTISQKEIVAGHRKFMDFAIGEYLKEKYPLLFPFYIVASPLLKTPLRGILIKFGKNLIFDKAALRKQHE